VVYFPDLKAVHVGDLIIDAMPAIDYANGGSAIEFIATIDKLLALDLDTMIPGHGRVMNKEDARAYRARFQAMNDRAKSIIKKGVKKPRFIAELKLDDFGWAKTPSAIAFMRSWEQTTTRWASDETGQLPTYLISTSGLNSPDPFTDHDTTEKKTQRHGGIRLLPNAAGVATDAWSGSHIPYQNNSVPLCL